jgi:hypothetical protein
LYRHDFKTLIEARNASPKISFDTEALEMQHSISLD